MIQRLIKTICGALAATTLLTAGAQAQVQLNEIYASHSGTDYYEFIELKGTPGTSLDNYLVLVVEGEGSATNQGTLDRAWDLTTYSIPASGYFVLGDTNLALGTVPTPPDFDIGSNDRIENGTETFYLINANSATNAATITGMLGSDRDPDGDFATDIVTVPGITVIEVMAIVDCEYYFIASPAILDHVFDSPSSVIGADGVCNPTPPPAGGFFPAGAFRGLDYPNAWCPDEYPDFNEIANLTQPRTPGSANSVCPSAPSIVNYCTAGTTTNGCLALLTYSGTPSVAATSGFVVTANTVEGQKNGIMFYGNMGPVATPWGVGGPSYLCVKSPTQRTGQQATNGTANACDGTMSLDLLAYLAANPMALGNPFSAGQQCWVQGWFRDPPQPKTTSLTDGLEVTFQP